MPYDLAHSSDSRWLEVAWFGGCRELKRRFSAKDYLHEGNGTKINWKSNTGAAGVAEADWMNWNSM